MIMWLGIAFALVVGLALAVRSVVRTRLRRANALACPPGIEWSGYVEINGAPQWLLIRGSDARNPLLLHLHGGPGWPSTFLAGHRYSAVLEKRFVVVHWEQRGAGKSYAARLAGTRVTNDQLVADVDAVARHLLAAFKRDKLYLIGHSWGSLLGILAITEHPERYHAFIGVGQFVNAIEQERLSVRFCLDWLESRGKKRQRARLAALGEPPFQRTFEAIVQQRSFLCRAGGSFGRRYSPTKMLFDAAVSPYYGLGDLWRFVRGGVFSCRCLLEDDYWQWALDTTHLRFLIPVCFFLGRRDYNTPLELAERYLERIEAPKKEKVVFESAAHFIPFEEPNRYNCEVVRVFARPAE
jgi:pimeloyl-ACP methyl ester carboxylesterase